MPPKINIYREGKLICSTEGVEGETLLERVTASGIFLDAPCGGRGRCGKCLVRLSPDGKEVRACQTHVNGDTDIYLPETMKMKIAGTDTKNGKKAALFKGPLGVAVDIGTTTVVAHLTDIPTKTRIATASGVNAQRPYGADVISRIQYSAKNGHEKLTKLIREQISELILEMCRATGADTGKIELISIAGNTIMQHLFAGYSPVGMGVVPFKTVSLFGEKLPAGDDLPVAKDAVIYYAPCVSAYVGGDITAGMMASDLENEKGCCLYIDIGTNGEIVMKVGDGFVCCATAAGPAFEGAEISNGMAAVSGAINHAKWEDGHLVTTTIDDARPIGLCGSGLLDTLALMLDTGAVDKKGRLLGASEAPAEVASYLGRKDGQNVFWLSREDDVYMTAGDVRKLQLAKSAIAAGIMTLMYSAGIEIKDISSFKLAGGFGSFMDQNSAAKIGMFPKELLPVTKAMGNTAGEGAAIALCSEEARSKLLNIRERCNYIELSASVFFNDQFIEQMMFE